MELIERNPYRILGVFSNASLKEITANKSKLARYSSVGKSVSFDADMNNVLPLVERNESSVEKAFADLSLPLDKLKHSLFWFVKDNSMDEMALEHLNTGNVDKALELFEKRESWSSLHNRGVLALIRNDLAGATRCTSKMIHTEDYREEMVNAICGDTFQISEEDVAKLYVDCLKEVYAPKELYLLFVTNGSSSIETGYLKESMTGEPVDKLNAEINKAKSVTEGGVLVYEAAVTLQQKAQPLLKELEELLGIDSVEFKLLSDKSAKTILQCCIDSFNTLQQKMEDGEVETFKEYAPKIKMLLASIDTSKVSDVLKERIESNLKTITEIVNDLDNYVRGNAHLCYYCGKNKAVPSAQYKQQMYFVTNRQYSFNKRQVFYKQGEIGIDRCEQCKAIHEKGEKGILFIQILVVIASIIIVGLVTEEFLVGLFLGWIPGLIIDFVIGALNKGAKKKKYHIKMQGDIDEHPVVKKLKSEGWTTTQPTA